MYRKVFTKERYPTYNGIYFTNDLSYLWDNNLGFWKQKKVEWWLEEIELPNNERINQEVNWRFTNGHGGVDEYSKQIFIHACEFMIQHTSAVRPFPSDRQKNK